MNNKHCEMFAAPGLTLSSNGENYIELLFSERPIDTVDFAK